LRLYAYYKQATWNFRLKTNIILSFKGRLKPMQISHLTPEQAKEQYIELIYDE
jgi:acyl-CoA-binding protein